MIPNPPMLRPVASIARRRRMAAAVGTVAAAGKTAGKTRATGMTGGSTGSDGRVTAALPGAVQLHLLCGASTSMQVVFVHASSALCMPRYVHSRPNGTPSKSVDRGLAKMPSMVMESGSFMDIKRRAEQRYAGAGTKSVNEMVRHIV